jgi:dihydrofolate reductase
MRKLKLQIQVSIDGYIADTNGRTDWMVWNWGPDWNWDNELKEYNNRFHEGVDCVLLSRKMAEEGFIDHWANVAHTFQIPFAKRIAEAKKVVFTKTLNRSKWKNTELASRHFVDEIIDLKKQEGKDMVVYGGASFVSSLLEEGLIDDFYLFVNPTALGEGVKIFNRKFKLNLIDSGAYECGVAVLHYIR